jgi:light-regulated signal transduction histidine kinase (bacteriophytochrome)
MTNLQLVLDESHVSLTHDPLPLVKADSSQMGQLLQNLIGNAIKFHGANSPHIDVSAREEPSEWLFSVKDNGIGIESEYFDTIFGIFQRLHGREEYPGSGVGLAICKRIVERHRGRMWVESEPGQGSTFYFTIPKDQVHA